MGPELSGTLGQSRRMRRGSTECLKFPGTLELAQTSSADSGQTADSFAGVRSQTKCARTFGHFRSEQAHAQGKAKSAKSFLALWNSPKLGLQTLGKLAGRLQSLVSRTQSAPSSEAVHAQAEA